MRDDTSRGASRRGMRGEGRTRHNSQRADPRRSVCGRGAAPQPHPQPYSPHADARILKPHSAHTALRRARPAAAFSFAISFLRAVSSFNGAVSGMAARLECPLTEHLHSFALGPRCRGTVSARDVDTSTRARSARLVDVALNSNILSP